MTDAHNPASTQWLSDGVEKLFAQDNQDYLDVVIVGSGYGGAIAAATLAGATRPDGAAVTVCVLERGREHLPGSFPASAAELPGHVRWSAPGAPRPQGAPEGLFDVRLGPDINALVANGLGGGSLINAGVMLQPEAATLARLGIASDGLQDAFDAARTLLDTPVENTIERHPGARPLKFEALAALQKRMGGDTAFSAVPISVAMHSGPNSAGVPMDSCIQCGDCATGCNHNAKLSLDTNLLVTAKRKGAALYTGATVLKIEPTTHGWCLHVVYTDAQLRQRHPSPFKVLAHKVILAAGTFGSTEILLRSRSRELALPTSLGQRFSGNGDMLAVAYNYPELANAISDDRTMPDARRVGPTITGRIAAPGPGGARLCFEELAVPAPLRRVFEEISTTAALLHRMGRRDTSKHTADGIDPCAVSPHAMGHSTILAVMGNDDARGELELTSKDSDAAGDGAIRVRWPGLRDHPLFEAQIKAIPVAEGGEELVLPNPAWRLLPKEMERMIVVKRGPLTTVHPLGGCAIGKSAADSVVNQNGQVHLERNVRAPAGTLVVLDGAIVPGALGVNPALTIAALALRAARALRTEWGYTEGGNAAPALAASPRRAAPLAPARPAATEVAVIERLSGPATLTLAGGKPDRYMIELTLRYVQRDIAQLCLPQDGAEVPLRRTQQVDDTHSEVAIYALAGWEALREKCAAGVAERPDPVARAPVGGRLDFLHREENGEWRRILAGIGAWARNRGGRDTWQRLRQDWRTRALFQGLKDQPNPLPALRGWWDSLLMVASRAGEVRRFDYDLAIKEDIGRTRVLRGAIRGHKRLTYGPLSNPWSQLSEMTLTAFPGLQGKAILTLDTDFLVEQNAPLLKIMAQQDQPSALLDLAGLGGVLARIVLNIHLWTFRKPDPPRARTPQRLPGVVRGLPPPQVSEVVVDALADGRPVCVRLTRYERADTTQAAVVLIHGYSTSGTAFAHADVNPNLASHLWTQGRDVWIVDLRTSSGMPYARWPWSFEEVALADIPAAIDLVCRVTQKPQVDLMAHCMGAAMTSMALLAQHDTGERFHLERQALPERIRRLVLSQVGPLVVFSPANTFRAYLMRYMLALLPRLELDFRVEGEPGLADELLDRLLSSQPYPRDELAIENSWWPFSNTEFAGARHRMDALYGRDFKLANMPKRVLAKLDDFFGPLNLVTVAQSVHFARRKTITNRAGRNVYVSRANLARLTFPILSIHGVENGLSNVATLARMEAILRDAGCRYQTLRIPGFGHQDSWLGRDAIRVFEPVAAFLSGSAEVAPGQRAPVAQILRIPAAGPVWCGNASNGHGAGTADSDQFSLFSSPLTPTASHVLCVPVWRQDDHFAVAPKRQPAGRNWDALPEDDGWVRLARSAGMAGPAGSLMLIVYDESEQLAPIGNPGLGALNRIDVTLGLHLPIAPDWIVPGIPTDTWKYLSASLRAKVDHLLATTPAADLEPGVLAPPVTASARGGLVSFAVGSCQYPPGLLDDEPAYQSYARLAAMLREHDPAAPDFVVLAGDQIYSDASAGLFDPSALDDRYKRPYEKLFANAHVRAVMRQRPVFMMLDDHEISDNWAPSADPGERAAFVAGCEGYRKYQRAMDLPDNSQWYTFTACGLPFFMADTRTERQARSVHNIQTAHIMHPAQMNALLDWLSSAPAGPRFVVTSSMLGLRRRELIDACDTARLRCDTWEGYPASMRRLLAHIHANRIENVVLLSGDEHISCDLTLTLSDAAGKAVRVRSIHASALYAPYPFANARATDFAPSPDRFSFAYEDSATGASVEIACTTEFTFCAQDGFALVTVDPAGTVDVTFNRAAPAQAPTPTPARQVATPSAPPQTLPPSGSAHRVSEMPLTGAP